MGINRRKVFTNVFWGFAERISAQLVSFIVSIIIARMLEPELFGTIALILIFLEILQIFIDSGLGNALIQKKDVDSIDYSTVFYVNIILCILLYVLMFFMAPLIAKFYKNEEISKLIRVLSLSLIVSGIKNIQYSYVSKNLIFKKFFFATLIGTICAAIVGIIMAYKGFGVWALVVQHLTNNTIDTLILWITVKWRPTKEFSINRLKVLYSYGWKIFCTSMINCIYNKSRELIIGKMYSTADLAFYNRGFSLSYLVVGNIDGSISNVIMPTMSNEQDDLEKVKQLMIKMMTLTSYILVPCLLGVVAIADNLILALLTEKWIMVVPYLRLFCLTFIFYPVYTGNLTVYKAIGRSDIYLKIELIKKIIGIALLLISLKFGPLYIAGAFLISGICEIFIDSFPNQKLINLGILKQFKYLWKIYLMGVLMCITVFFFGKIEMNLYLKLVLQILIGILEYIILSVLFKDESFMYIFNLLKKRVDKRRTENAEN